MVGEIELNKIYHMDCIDGLKKISDDSIDLIVTDPPYGISFMQRHWDKAIPSVDIWRECVRVLKPGAFAFVMCIPRQDCLSRMIISLENSGFNTSFASIYYTFASGFPKSTNIGKTIDKKLGAGLIVEHVSNQAKSLNGSYAGFQPKPAVEIILVVMKPLSEKSYVDQALKNKHGISWLDDCRIPYKENVGNEFTERKSGGMEAYAERSGGGSFQCLKETNKRTPDTKGRFPANLLVSDDILNDGKNWDKGGSVPNKGKQHNLVYGKYAERPIWESYNDSGSFSRYFDVDKWFTERFKKLPEEVQKTFPFLIVPKPSKSEKDKGLEKHMEKNREGVWNGSPDDTGKFPEHDFRKAKNFHPTCKPIQLMSYLITLGSRKNDVVLDPFVGSGTTCISARMLSRKYIGIEIESKYVKIANDRLKMICNIDEWI